MGMTMSEKIMSTKARKTLRPGDLIELPVDLILANDITAPVAIQEMEKYGLEKVFDPTKIVLVPDHFTPNKDIASATQSKVLREFAQKMKIQHYFEIGEMGIEHCLLPERGLILPGEILVGADSHTCTAGALGAFATGMGSTDIAAAMATGKVWFRVPETFSIQYNGRCREWVGGKDLILYTIGEIGVDGANYMALEFKGEAITHLSMDHRFTMANMAVEAGGKAGLMPVDQKTRDYIEARIPEGSREYRVFESDEDAKYTKTLEIDASSIDPQVALPSLPSNSCSVDSLEPTSIHQVVIGSCTNGRIEDLQVAAQILKNRKVSKGLRVIIIPGTQAIYLEALERGYIKTFIESNAVVSTPTCGPCLGGHMGILAKGERALATTNRNFVGRMGDPESFVYLAGPAVAAASAITGKISHPEEVLS